MQKIVLIVEDQKSMALYLQDRLSQVCSLPVRIAHSLEEARQVVDEDVEVLVCLSDLHLPDAMQGEIVTFLQRNRITTVVLTANYSEQTRQEMFKAHVADYVIKDGQAAIDYAITTVVKLVNNADKEVWLLASKHGCANKLVGLLKIHRYPLQVFEDPKILLKSLHTQAPDILLLEECGQQGSVEIFNFVNEVRARFSAGQLPMMVCGASGDLPMAIKLMKYGVNDFFNTSFSAEEFYVRLNQNLEQSEAYKKIERISQTDALTQLYNRGYFFKRAGLAFAKSSPQDFFVVMADIDHFKAVNDTHGHQKGDEAIQFTAAHLQKIFSPYLVARFGGEEFCVFGTGAAEQDVAVLCERFRQAVAAQSQSDTGVHFTVSIGLSFQGDSLENAILHADSALYEAKENGRNRLVISSCVQRRVSSG